LTDVCVYAHSCELLYILSAVEMLHDSALYKFAIDIGTNNCSVSRKSVYGILVSTLLQRVLLTEYSV